jgi:hypothetical protein
MHGETIKQTKLYNCINSAVTTLSPMQGSNRVDQLNKRQVIRLHSVE